MSLEPPPRIVDKFVNIWRDWLFFFWEFVDSHTGGSSPTPPATGTSWNAHGNIATGQDNVADSNISVTGDPAVLVVEGGSFLMSGAVGGTPDIDQAGSYFAYIPSKSALRLGSVADGKWADANIGIGTVAIGDDSESIGIYSLALGINAKAAHTVAVSGLPHFGCLAIGIASEADSFRGTAIGFESKCYSNNGLVIGTSNVAGASGVVSDNEVAIGLWTSTSANGAISIGSGTGPGNLLDNPTPASMYLGVGATNPTFVLRNGRAGVGNETNPLSTLDVAGSVGFQYTNLSATNGATYIISGDEYTFRIDLNLFTANTDEYTIQLPTISSTAIDRRIYYFKVTDITHQPGNHGDVLLQPESSQYMEDFAQGDGHRLPAGDPLRVQAGQSITIIANATDETWWVI